MRNLAIFASGSGTNAENLIRYFANHPSIRVKIVLTNNQNAYVLSRANALNVDTFVFDRCDFYETEKVINILKKYDADYLVLAGFLWLVPQRLTAAFPHRIVNIHPALLPAYGGKGMYGMHVHRAIIAAGEKQSGITIHEVNEEYDRGAILFQNSCPITSTDTPETLADKIHSLEQAYFPVVVEKWVKEREEKK